MSARQAVLNFTTLIENGKRIKIVKINKSSFIYSQDLKYIKIFSHT
jgi:hypothetical protein